MQLTYPLNMKKAFAGMLADSGFTDKLSGAAQETIPFGCAVLKGTADDQVKLPAVSGDVALIRGIALHTFAITNHPEVTLPSYVQYDAVSYIHKGRVYVQVEEAVAPGDAVFVRYGGTAPLQKGAFRKTTVSGEAAQLSDGSMGSKAKWLSSAGIGEFAVLEVNF